MQSMFNIPDEKVFQSKRIFSNSVIYPIFVHDHSWMKKSQQLTYDIHHHCAFYFYFFVFCSFASFPLLKIVAIS